MKRLTLILSVIFTLFLIACQNNPEHLISCEITNDSSFNIDFKLNNEGTVYSIKSKEVLIIQKNINDSIALIDHPRVDVIKRSNYYITFSDTKAIQVKVYNPLSIDVVLSERNGYIGITSGETVNIAANSKATFWLYTKNPEYVVTTKIDGQDAVVDISNLIFY